MIVRIHEMVGPKGLTRELGEKVKTKIGDDWKRDTVTLDFSGVSVASPSFLDEAVGHIVQQITEGELKSRLVIQNEPEGFELAWKNMVGARRARALSGE